MDDILSLKVQIIMAMHEIQKLSVHIDGCSSDYAKRMTDSINIITDELLGYFEELIEEKIK